MTSPKLTILLIALAIALVLTTGCLDDLSSTMDPCCDGTCNMTKTSVVTTDGSHRFPEMSSIWNIYIVDSDGTYYAPDDDNLRTFDDVDALNFHNVTFRYQMIDGHRHITEIIRDYTEEVEAGNCCKSCCTCQCQETKCGGCV